MAAEESKHLRPSIYSYTIMNQEQNIEDSFSLLRSGVWMNGFAADIGPVLVQAEELCFHLNTLPPSRQMERQEIIRRLMGTIGNRFILHSPFHCDFGMNIHIGENFVGNFNLTILDEAEVRIGDNVFIGPNVSLCTVVHAFHADQRNNGIMCAKPITIGNNVWIASNVTVLPGVNIGEGAIIGAGSVVTKDVPPLTLAAGNPCRIIRPINESDRV